MGRGEDRISNLPESVLQSILTMMPLKSAIRTDVLSKKWRNLWKYSLYTATALDFGDDLANNLSATDFVETVNRYLSLHASKKLERFHLFFSPFDLFASDIERWISYAIGKGVRYLDIDLSQGEFSHGRSPFDLPSLFDCDTLIDLSLCCCNFKSPLNLSNFGGLQSLSLSHSNISEEMLQTILTECSLLESLSLRSCKQLGAISIMVPNLKLKRLIIRDCQSFDLLEINAPKLQSFHYFGRLCIQTNLLNISSLKDVSICFNTGGT
ncbi:F-box/FBD/LRR-repeat protein At1g13570-like [Dendrobium catenatum]|uniref:F-box/FBD/LRR-repeat protein At1g13570-like n=1 Tax=Dendrobium catenatum TaxID=906689 RepID=UPI00109F9D00|nr:F-box/FBD/LRR-repeat protein At1g13570-like [Dendrobium catenatum]